MSRRVLLWRHVAVVLSAALVSGCMQLPLQVTETTAASKPAWTVPAAAARRAEVAGAINAAAKDKNVVAGAKYLDNSERATYVNSFDFGEKYGEDPPNDTWRGTDIAGLWTTSGTTYPQVAFIWVKLKAEKPKDLTQLLEVYTKGGATAPWLRSETAFLDETVDWLPSGTVIEAPSRSINGLTLPSLPEFVYALNHSEDARADRYEKTSDFKHQQDWLAEEKKSEGYREKATAKFSISSDVWALPIKGGTLILVPLNFTYGWSYPASLYYKWGKPYDREWPGKYTTATFNDDVTMLIRVADRGRITFPGPATYDTGSLVCS